MFGFGKRKIEKRTYDSKQKQPALHISICTGEKVAGFKDLQTGKFEDVMLIATEKDLKEFCQMYGITESDLKKDW